MSASDVISATLLPTLRRAILEVPFVVVRYGGHGTEGPATQVLCLYGTRYGGNGPARLVGHVEGLPQMHSVAARPDRFNGSA